MHWFEGFEIRHFEVDGAQIYARVSSGLPGDRPALLLLHGFPQSHVMWHRVAQQLQRDFYLVMPDLRGYGDSAKPAGLPDHSNYSKRTLAQDMVAVMDALGLDTFDLCGHDRGGRVAHRLATDHPQRVRRLCVIDIAPTLDMYNATDFAFARAYYHWFHLIQPAPLPETMINCNPLAYLHAKLGGWGAGGLDHIELAALAEYEHCFSQPATVHSQCEDYRASAGIDLTHDRESRARGDQIACDMLVLWGERGVVHQLFKPHELWQAQCAGTVTGQTLPAGHFIPEELPQATAAALLDFFRHGQ
ncbi:MAG: alpha/beta hydrolase [Rhodoferax sp.]|uniref:alpha/beta fold hydrolase n=1 Tax=Rhodoferax sp. TaxID=50421 RepID=UPI00182EEE63|nr:alpha/beta hydrolase [Rhodoferax sp.]NMM14414.1 alpha/beta hydrolase [Rhodoferax sp.]NMM19012.1 alpha/beta hydrolase [Rhodoferax sp.]